MYTFMNTDMNQYLIFRLLASERDTLSRSSMKNAIRIYISESAVALSI